MKSLLTLLVIVILSDLLNLSENIKTKDLIIIYYFLQCSYNEYLINEYRRKIKNKEEEDEKKVSKN